MSGNYQHPEPAYVVQARRVITTHYRELAGLPPTNVRGRIAVINGSAIGLTVMADTRYFKAGQRVCVSEDAGGDEPGGNNGTRDGGTSLEIGEPRGGALVSASGLDWNAEIPSIAVGDFLFLRGEYGEPVREPDPFDLPVASKPLERRACKPGRRWQDFARRSKNRSEFCNATRWRQLVRNHAPKEAASLRNLSRW